MPEFAIVRNAQEGEKMKIRGAIVLFAAVLFSFSLSLAGCATTGSSTTGESLTQDSVSVTLVSESDLRARFGRTPADNPFVAALPTLFPKPYDFVAMSIDVASPSGGDLEILQAEAQNEKGKVFATYYTRQDFAKLAASLTYDDTKTALLQNKISWYYLPANKTRVKSGKSAYLLILVGKHPLPSELTAGVRVLFNDEEKDFTLPIPDAAE
jgi:hypothetical protein